MKALVCYKWVPDEADIIVDYENHSLNMEKAKLKISEYDRNAIELGAALAESNSFTVESFTVGKGTKASVTDVLARGIEKAYYVETEELDSMASARVIAEAVKKIGDVDLVICGEGSGDQYSQQVGPRVAALLDYQLVTYVSSFAVDEDKMKMERKLEDGVETVSVKGPTVVTVLSEVNTPRIPGMKQILSAKKKPSVQFTLEDLGLESVKLDPAINVKKVGPSIMDRKQIKVNDGDLSIKESVEKLVQFLRTTKAIN